MYALAVAGVFDVPVKVLGICMH